MKPEERTGFMKTLIVYVTKSGTTEECAQRVRELLGRADTDLLDLKVQRLPDFAAYDCIVLGSYIHYGKIGKRLKRFVSLHKEMLLEKKLGIFLCKGFEGELKETFSKNFKPKLLRHALVYDSFGGVLQPDKLKGTEKRMAKMVQKTFEQAGKQPPQLDPDRIERFAQALLK